MRSKRSPATGASRSPRRARTGTSLRRPFSHAVSAPRRETSTVVSVPPWQRAAAIPTAPEPAHSSSTRAPRGRDWAQAVRASSQESEIGRNTPGRTRSLTPLRPTIGGAVPNAMPAPAPTAAALRAAFEAPPVLGVGVEEELFLLDADTLDLLPRAREVLERTGGDPRFKLELPAAQLEIVTPPCATVPEALAALAAGRRDLAAAAATLGGRLAAAGAHPFADPLGVVNAEERYERTLATYGDIARRQLVAGLHVHVSLGGAERSLAVYNALRGHLPELAALAANAPFHAGSDTGLASVRPTICTLLPRQGTPPALPSWEAYADALRWGAAAGTVPEPRNWWWEVRPHALYGTLELRVPDAQASLAEAGAIAAFVHALVAWLGERHDA